MSLYSKGIAMLLSVAAAAAGAVPAHAEDAADLILTHGVFYPVATPGRVEGSLAIRAGRIVYLGPAAGAEALRGAATQVIDLAGRAATPGLIDAHSHLLSLGAVLTEVDLTGAASYAEVVRRVAAAAARTPAGAWVRGRGWDQNRWADKSFPRHGALSAAVPDRPVWLDRVDGHAALLNARAMALLGIAADTPDPPGGRYLRDEQGHLTGVLLDNAKDAAAEKLPAPTAEELQADIAAAPPAACRVGLTTVTDMGLRRPGARRLPRRCATPATCPSASPPSSPTSRSCWRAGSPPGRTSTPRPASPCAA